MLFTLNILWVMETEKMMKLFWFFLLELFFVVDSSTQILYLDGIEETSFYTTSIKFIIKNNLHTYKAHGNSECREIIFYLNGIGNTNYYTTSILKKSVQQIHSNKNNLHTSKAPGNCESHEITGILKYSAMFMM